MAECRQFATKTPIRLRMVAKKSQRIVTLDKKITGGIELLIRRILIVTIGLAVILGSVLLVRGLQGPVRVQMGSTADLAAYFEDIDYTANTLQAGDPVVPRVWIAVVPANWSEGLTVDQKKSLFYRALLPMALHVNEEIMADRERLDRLSAELTQNKTVSGADQKWFEGLARGYGLSARAGEERVKLTKQAAGALLRRVDAIPPSLVLAQGAVESAYGSSRFAVEGNSLFGQWHFGKGLVPAQQRTELGDYRIAIFDSPLDSIRAYAKNLNSNRAYIPFRTMRADARAQGRSLRGAPLAGGLLAYSEKGEEYVSLLRSLITRNQLSVTDGAKLREMRTVQVEIAPF